MLIFQLFFADLAIIKMEILTTALSDELEKHRLKLNNVHYITLWKKIEVKI